MFKENPKIILKDKLEMFLNGVKLRYDLPNGLYRIYENSGKFIGIGEIHNNLLKRDVII